ncbi:hypothetical protein GCM10009122_07550 [Fulvivirga kasyanovii]|uniref:DUF4369 domain-containing protein n=1 Tax=Fulvivirga kasyanovii TaxID=396812 RepID=A0ABW9RPJ4_9BACT|nr:hypothetical protein [Fulvivirga kasyanovii]MTI25025.1 hypothetical protein [Fulvivirga kasyanovii]
MLNYPTGRRDALSTNFEVRYFVINLHVKYTLVSRFQQIFILPLFSTLLLVTNISVAQYDEVGATNRMFYYSGHLGNTEKVEFNLQINGPTVSGSYIVERTGGLYTFSGRMASDKSAIGLIIFDEENQFIATIEAKLISEDNNFAKEIKGRWKSSDGKRQVNLNLKKVAELASIDTSGRSGQYGFTSQKDLNGLIAGFEPLDDHSAILTEDMSMDISQCSKPSVSGAAASKKCFLKDIINTPEFQMLGRD